MALAGNPNAGKTTLFNQLTGARQHVGNYPGITVDHKEGTLDHQGTRITITDLPGTYSMTAYSVEELVARILDEYVCELEGEQLDVGVVVTEAGDEFESGFRGRDARGSDCVGEAEGGVQVEGGLGGQEVRSALLCVRACGWASY